MSIGPPPFGTQDRIRTAFASDINCQRTHFEAGTRKPPRANRWALIRFARYVAKVIKAEEAARDADCEHEGLGQGAPRQAAGWSPPPYGWRYFRVIWTGL